MSCSSHSSTGPAQPGFTRALAQRAGKGCTAVGKGQCSVRHWHHQWAPQDIPAEPCPEGGTNIGDDFKTLIGVSSAVLLSPSSVTASRGGNCPGAVRASLNCAHGQESQGNQWGESPGPSMEASVLPPHLWLGQPGSVPTMGTPGCDCLQRNQCK